jgi:hypothetical protein
MLCGGWLRNDRANAIDLCVDLFRCSAVQQAAELFTQGEDLVRIAAVG